MVAHRLSKNGQKKRDGSAGPGTCWPSGKVLALCRRFRAKLLLVDLGGGARRFGPWDLQPLKLHSAGEHLRSASSRKQPETDSRFLRLKRVISERTNCGSAAASSLLNPTPLFNNYHSMKKIDISHFSHLEKLATLTHHYLELRLPLAGALRAANADLQMDGLPDMTQRFLKQLAGPRKKAVLI